MLKYYNNVSNTQYIVHRDSYIIGTCTPMCAPMQKYLNTYYVILILCPFFPVSSLSVSQSIPLMVE